MAEISEFISPKAEKQQQDYITNMRIIASTYSDIAVEADKVNKKYEETEKHVTDNAKAQKELNDAKKDDEKVQKDLEKAAAALEKQRQRGLAIMAKEEFQSRKLREASAKEVKSIKDAREANKALRKVRDELANDTENYDQTLQDLNSTIDENDAFIKENTDSYIKQKIEIGNYEDAIRSALDGTEAFSGGTGDVINNFINISQQEGGIKSFFQTFVGGMKSAIKAGLKFIMTPIGAVIFAIVAAIGLFTAAISRNEKSGDKFGEIWEGITIVIEELIGRIFKLAGAIGRLFKGDFKGAAAQAKEAITGVGKAMKIAFEEGKKLHQMQVQLEESTIAATKAIADLNAETEKQQAIADDSTRSFAEISAALEKVRKTSAEAAAEQSELNKKELDIVNVRLAQAVRQGRVTRELRQEQADAYAAYIDGETQYTVVVANNEKERRQLRQDRLEKDLDILIDGFDNIKGINERIINDDKKTFFERQSLLLQTASLGTRSFQKQIGIIQSFTKERVNANDLIMESDATILNNKIRELGLSEIIEGRLLEIIRDRRTAIADLDEAQVNLVSRLVEVKDATTEYMDEQELLKMMNEDMLETYVLQDEMYQTDAESFELAEQRKRDAKMQTFEAIKQIFGAESKIGKLATAAQQIEATRQNLISLGIISAKSAEAQAKSAAALPFPANIPLILGTIAQFVGIVRTFRKAKTPKFADGLRGDYEGYGIWGEKGRELKIDPDGSVSMANSPTSGYIKSGTTILSNPETERIVNATKNANHDGPLRGLSRDDYIRGTDKIVRALKDTRPRFNRSKKTMTERVGNTVKNYYDVFS